MSNYKHRRELKNLAMNAIDKYLTANGWKCPDVFKDVNYIDPKTELSHRLDFAFIVQSEGDIYEHEEYIKSKGMI